MTFAFFFESVGGGEWLVLLAVVLVVIGPKNLPSAARKMGQILSQLRRAADEFKRQIMTMDQEVTRAVDDVKKEYIDTPLEDAAGGASASGSDGVPEYDPDSPYPGHEEFYDATDYQNEYGDGAPGADAPADVAASAVTGEAPAAPAETAGEPAVESQQHEDAPVHQ